MIVTLKKARFKNLEELEMVFRLALTYNEIIDILNLT